MSYIRSTSNPEGLYVYHDVNGHIYFNCSKSIPANIFYRFIREIGNKYHGSFNMDYKLGQLEVKEIFYPSKKKIPEAFKVLGMKPGNYKMTLYWKGKEIARMWVVTWQYIANNAFRNILRRDKKKKGKSR